MDATRMQDLPDVALFRDATEILFALGAARRGIDPAAPAMPARHFVHDADEAHAIALDGPQPVVGMSLDDLLDCASGGHAHSGELVAITGIHRGFLKLMARPGIGALADLRGRRIAIDTDTGYARALFEILSREGLARDRDFEVVYADATNLRYEKLMAGAFDATVLGAPFTTLAERAGHRALVRVIDALGGYQAIVLTARRPWIAANPGAVARLTTAISQTLAWACDPANAAQVIALLGALFPAEGEAAVSEMAEEMFGRGTDFGCEIASGDLDIVLGLFNGSSGRRMDRAAAGRLLAVP